MSNFTLSQHELYGRYVNKVVKIKRMTWRGGGPLQEQIPLDIEGSGPADQGLLIVTFI